MNNICLSGRIHEIRIATKCTYITVMIQGGHETEWIDVTLFANQAKFFHQYFEKGKYINIIGHLRNTKYKDQYRTEVVADTIGFCGAKVETDTSIPTEWIN